MRTSRSSGSGRRRTTLALAVALALVAGLGGVVAQAAPGTLDRISIPDTGGERNVLPTGSSLQCNAQNAGKCTKRAVALDTANNKIRVAWASAANNLVPNDNNGKTDIFLTTLTPSAAGAPPTIDSVERINIGTGGVEANGESQGPSISPNGQWVSFDSLASNLVGNDNNSANDVFTYNVVSKALYRVSIAQAPATEGTGASFASSVADDGSTSFTSYNALVPGATTAFQQVYVRKTPAASPSTVLVSVNNGNTSSGNAPSLESTISAAGNKVAFTTQADDTVAAGSKTKGIPDIVVRDLAGNSSRLVSHDAKAGAPSMSADGSTVAFIAEAIGPNKGIYKVSTGGMAGAGDYTAACTSAACQAKPKAAVLPSLNGNGAVLAFQSSAKYNDLQINSDQVWTGPSTITLISHDRVDATKPGNGPAVNPSVSPDGTYVVFESAADNLVGDDFNGSTDIFLAQPAAPGATVRVSVPSNGGEASGFAPAPTAPPTVSADGNIVAFESDSSNLVPGDTNGVTDIFVRDRNTGHTDRVSVATDGTQGNKGSFRPGISGDGRFVVFESAASNLLPGGADSNGVKDVFLRDRQTNETRRISESNAPSPSQNPSISPNGQFIAFDSNGNFGLIQGRNTNVTNVFRYSNQAAGGDGSILMVSTQPPGKNNPSRQAPNGKSSFQPSVANEGSVAFLSDATGLTGFDGDDPPGAKPNYTDVYVALPNATVIKASMSNSTYQGADGAPHQSPATGDSYRPSINADGTKVAFASDATNLPTAGADQNPDTDVFLRDIPGAAMRLVDQPPSGVPGGASTAPAISGDGSAVAFVSSAPNLVAGDTNGQPDVFLANMANGGISRVNLRPGADGFQPDGPSYLPGLSGNGLIVAFGSSAANLVDGDQNHVYDVFVRVLGELPGPCSGCGAGAAPAYSGPGYRFVSSDGGIFSFGDAKFYGSAGGTKLAKPIAGMTATPSNGGYWLVASDGGIFSYGDAKFYGSTGSLNLNSPIVGMTTTPSGAGYWFVAADGGIFSFGDAKFHGSMGGQPLTRPIVGMMSTVSGKGYWLVASDGGIFSFGDAKFYGSTGAMRLNRPIVGMAATPSGAGYWLVASDGGVFAFGDALFFGSTGGIVLNKPITGMSASRSGRGYRFVASDGGLFSFGDAAYAGSAAGRRLANPIVGVAGSSTGNGYWLAGSSGAIYPYGDATNRGSTAGSPIPAPIVTILAQPKAPEPSPSRSPDEPSGQNGVSGPGVNPDGTFQIALIGDTGYTPDEDRMLLKTRTAISSRPYAFVVHDGDIQGPGDPCTDERLAYVYETFDGFSMPFVFAPGDNEWADCPDSAERLAAIRHQFFANGQSLGQRRMTLTRQDAPFVENARWTAGNVVFATLNVPGPTGRSSGADGLSEANVAWLNAAFDTAEAQRSPGVMLIWQDDPFDGNSDDALEDALTRRARHFGKPVVLVHGDTHVYRLGTPWSDAPNLTELQTYALENTDRWVQVTVDPSSSQVFSFSTEQS